MDSRTRIDRLLEILVLGLLLFSGGCFLHFAWQIIPFPYPIDYGEAAQLDQTLQVARMQQVYRPDLQSPPYVLWLFPPLHSLIQVPALWAFGPRLWYGRLLQTLGGLLAAYSLFAVLRILTRDRVAAAVGGILFLAIPMVAYWSVLNRVDGLALGLSWASLLVLVSGRNRERQVVLAALLMAAAIFTRQSYALAAPFASLVYLMRGGERRGASRYLLVLAGVSVSLFLLLSAFTSGGFFVHTILANVNQYRAENVVHLLVFLVVLMPALLGSGLLFGFYPRSGRIWDLGGPYLLGALLSALTVGKVGANVNYFFELFAALALAAGGLLAVTKGAPRRVLLVALGLQIVLFLHFDSPQQKDARMRIHAREELSQLQAMVAESPGPVLADEYLGLVPLVGRDIYFQPFIFSQLARLERWDQDPLLQEVESQRFPLVLRSVVDGEQADQALFWTAEILAAMDRRYEVGETFKGVGIEVLRPKGTGSLSRESGSESSESPGKL